MRPRKIPGGHKRRVQDFFNDITYWDKLSPKDKRWLLDNLVNPVLNNDLRDIDDPEVRREYRRDNERYYEDIYTKGARVSGDTQRKEIDAIIQQAEETPLVEQRSGRAKTKNPKKRIYTGHVMTPSDYGSSYETFEDALIEKLDEEE